MNHQLAPWEHHEEGWPPDDPGLSETMLALTNGYLGVRGTLDEGSPAVTPGTYLGGFHEVRDIPYSERGYGDPEIDQVLVGVADGTRIRLLVEGKPLDLRSGTPLRHERALDLRTGVLRRTLRWRSPRGDEVEVRSRRLVSLVHRELAAIEYVVEPVRGPLRLLVHSELVAQPPSQTGAADPRASAPLPRDTLVPRLAEDWARGAVLVHETRRSRNVVAAAMEHEVLGPAGRLSPVVRAGGDMARWSLAVRAAAGRPLRIVKLLAYHWAPGGDPRALARAARRTLEAFRGCGFDALVETERAALDEVWMRADIEIDGDPELQHAIRYATFQLHRNAARAEGRAIPAKGLTGPGYSGHTFWDMEIFLLPVLTHCAPGHAEEALRWRAATLPKAREKAARLGLRGAAFPWRTIAGEECSGYLPAGTAAFHVTAAVGHAAARHVAATGDERFERDVAAPLLVETARMWVSLGHHDPRRGGRFSIDGVTGPDEYSPLVDNNLYTNLMARGNLRAAADLVDRLGTVAARVDPDEVRAWRAAADAMTIPYDEELGVHLQDEDFVRHAPFDFAARSPEDYPLLLHVPYFELYRRQVVKQADLVLAMALCGDAFTPEQKRRNLAYYEPLTVRDSSLSAGTQAVLAAEVGALGLAYDYLAEALLLDHHDIASNTAEGLHLAALAGGWSAIVEGLAGVRQRGDGPAFAPRLPPGLSRIAFRIEFQGSRLAVEVFPRETVYRLLAGAALEIEHHGERVQVSRATPASRANPSPPEPPPLRQPPARRPRPRRRG